MWPAATGQGLPSGVWPFASAGAFLLGSAAIAFSSRMLARAKDSGDWPARVGIACACLLLGAALFIEWKGYWQTGLHPADTSYGALVYTMIALEGQLVATAVIMGFYTIARSVGPSSAR